MRPAAPPGPSVSRFRRAEPVGVALLLALSAVALLGAAPTVRASTVVSITTSSGPTVCPAAPLSGKWNGATETCSVTGTLTISSGTTLDVGAGVTVTAAGATSSGSTPGGTGIDNGGTINNDGTMTGVGGFGGYYGSGYGGYGIDNSGTINNEGTMAGVAGEGGDLGGNGGIGFNNGGTINNEGTMSGAGGLVGNNANVGGNGIDNSGTVNDGGTMTGGGGQGYCCGGHGILNVGTVNIEGTMSGSGGFGISFGGAGINNAGNINDAGTMTGGGGPDYYGTGSSVANSGTIDEYCGITLSGVTGAGSVTAITCYTVTFDQSGLPTAGVPWGVTVSWGLFTFPQNHAGTGASVSVQAVGSLAYSYDSPVSGSGTSYYCRSGCSGTSTVSGNAAFSGAFTALAPRIPPSAAPQVLDLTIGNSTTVVQADRVQLYDSTVVYNIPYGFNGTLASQDLLDGNAAAGFALLPNTVTYCKDSGGNIRASGFYEMWFGGSLNSTEVELGYYQSFVTSSVGWPSVPACTS